MKSFFIILGSTLSLFLLQAREARASCAAPEACVCSIGGAISGAFVAVVTETSGKISKAKIESIELSAGQSALLKVGDVVDVDTSDSAAVGDRFLGTLSVQCESGFGDKCGIDDPTREEHVGDYRSIDAQGFVSCRVPDSEHRFKADKARAALASGDDCVEVLGDYVPEFEGCNDVACPCAVGPGVATAAGASGAGPLAALAVAAAAPLLRRRTRRRPAR